MLPFVLDPPTHATSQTFPSLKLILSEYFISYWPFSLDLNRRERSWFLSCLTRDLCGFPPPFRSMGRVALGAASFPRGTQGRTLLLTSPLLSIRRCASLERIVCCSMLPGLRYIPLPSASALELGFPHLRWKSIRTTFFPYLLAYRSGCI